MINDFTEAFNREKVKVTIQEKIRILKNIFILSLAFMVHFTSYQGIANLQSSINAENNLGTNALASIYATISVSCIFLPTFVIRILTAKWTIVVCMLCYIPFLVLQLHPHYGTFIPASILLGLGAGPMWAAVSTYVTQLGQVYAIITDQPVSGVIVQFFGFFFLAWQLAELWGNLVSSLVLSNSRNIGSGSNDSINENGLKICGAKFCNDDSKFLLRPSDREIYQLIVIYLTCVITAVLIITMYLDSLRRYGEKRKGSNSAITSFRLLLATLHQMIKPKQLLLMPITIWIGIEQSFIGADFTRSYVTCTLGVEYIGFVMICFGVVNAICSILFGSIMKYIGRIPIAALGGTIHLAIVIFMLFWRPESSHGIIFLIISGLWGVADAVWQTQINGFYGILFRRNKEAAFANYRLWESAGFAIGYGLDTLLCTETKLYMLLTILLIGLIGYIVVEIEYVHKQQFLQEIESRMHSNISLYAKHSFLNQLLHVPELNPSLHLNTGDPEDDEIDELEDDIVIEEEDSAKLEASKR